MVLHRDRRTTKSVTRTPLRPTGYGGIGPSATLPLLDRWGDIDFVGPPRIRPNGARNAIPAGFYHGLLPAIMILTLLLPMTATAQGIRMAPDFLPLDVGNLWRYNILDPEGVAVGSLEFGISDYSIVDGYSYYVFDRFPFGPDLEVNRPIRIRYDGQQRQFIRFDGAVQADLFPSPGASAEVLATNDDGLPTRALFRFGSLVLTLERGVGIVQAGFLLPEGPRVASLVAARVSGGVVGTFAAEDPGPSSGSQPLTGADPVDAAETVSDMEPELTVEAVAERDLHRFVLTVRNPSDRLLPFDFTTSQSFDFVVVDPSSGQELWRWSERRFFSEVLRSEAIRSGGDWTFEGEWNYRDSELNEVEPGVYEVYGVLASEEPLESDSIQFEVP